MFLSKVRAIWSGVLAIILVFVAMNFMQRNINIIATRTTDRVIFDYAFNIVLFFIILYLLISLISFIVLKLRKK